MTEKQLQTIVGLITGMEVALVHLTNTLCQQTGTSSEAVAKSFDDTAAIVPPAVYNKEMIQMVLRHVAAGIRRDNTPGEFYEEVHRLLH